MSKNRITQNKPQRDEQNAKERTDLKRENQRLKKQLGRLRKQLAHLVDLYGLEGVNFEEAEITTLADVEAVVPSAAVCEKCGANAKEVDMAGRSYQVCCACNWRKKV